MVSEIRKQGKSRLRAICLASVPLILLAGNMSPYIIKSFQEGNIPKIIMTSFGGLGMVGLSYVLYKEN